MLTFGYKGRCIALVTCHMGSHSVICHPTEVNAPLFNPSQIRWYSIYLPRRYGRLRKRRRYSQPTRLTAGLHVL